MSSLAPWAGISDEPSAILPFAPAPCCAVKPAILFGSVALLSRMIQNRLTTQSLKSQYLTSQDVTALACALFAVPASAEWNEKVLYSFKGGPNGSVPAGGVVFDKAGNLYGVTFDGVVFQLKPPVQEGRSWTENMLYVFQGVSKGDGSTPSGGLVIDSVGNLYGVTAYGGTGDCVLLGNVVGCGTVYEISPPKEKGGAWKETILYSFPASKQGYLPNGDLVFDSAGNLYGATTFGGRRGTTCDDFYGGNCGAVFELSPPRSKGGKWTETVLHSFASGTDGASPNGGLVLDGKGNVYGNCWEEYVKNPMVIATPKVATRVFRSHNPSHFTETKARSTGPDVAMAGTSRIAGAFSSRSRRRSSSAKADLASSVRPACSAARTRSSSSVFDE